MIRITAAICAILFALSPAAAKAAAMSMNKVVLPADMGVEVCKSRGGEARRRIGLERIPDSPAAVFGVGPNGLLATIYCLPEHGVAIVSVAADSQAETRPILARLLSDLRER